MSEPRSLRCPLCCQIIVCRSEAECEQHIARCSEFRQQFGDGARRAGLVTGFNEAVVGATASANYTAATSTSPTLDSAVDALAAAFCPILKVQLQENPVLDEAITLVVALLGPILAAPKDDHDFTMEDVITVTLLPYQGKLGTDEARYVQSLLPAIEAVRGTNAPAAVVNELLLASFKRQIGQLVNGDDAAFQVGQRVLISGLASAPLLNGKAAIIVAWDATKGRYAVDVEGKKILVKPGNLSASVPS